MTSEICSTELDKKPLPGWYSIMMTVACVWNLMGVLAFVGQMMITPQTLAQMPEAEQQLYLHTPLWATIAFGVAVFAGMFGCIALLLKKAMAKLILVTSLIAVCIQMFHAFFISDSFAVFGPGGVVMPIMVITIACLLVWFSVRAKKVGWIK